MKRNVNLFLLCLLTFCVAVISCNENKTEIRDKYSVVIVGGGIAGIAAAGKLLENNVTNILILEASDRFGGRVHTAPFGDFWIEYGAQWIHGQYGNAVHDIVESYNVTTVEYIIDKIDFLKHPASKVNISVVNEMFEEVFDIFEDDELISTTNSSMKDYFLSRFEQVINSTEYVDSYTREALIDIVLKYQGSHDGTGDLSKEGTWGYNQYLEVNGSLTVGWKSGYRTLINILLGEYGTNKLPVREKTRFNKVVTDINWAGNEVKLMCEDGSQYFADHTIVTVSLGVLKQSAKTMFTPPLPERKLSAIQSLGFDLVNKIFVQFHERWWPMEYEYLISFVWSDEDKIRFKNISKYGAWTTEISIFHSVINQPRVLEGWLVGEAAYNLEHLTDKEITDAVEELLLWFIGDKFNVSRIINVTRSTWSSNRFIRGSYSFRTLHSDQFGYFAEDIAKPILNNYSTPVLLFAGEATHDHFFSTVHGALETGQREALRLVDSKTL